MSNEKIIIVGFSGLGREVLWAALRAQALTPGWNAELLGYTERAAAEGPEIDGLPYLGLEGPGLLDLKPAPTHFICAIGENRLRRKVCAVLEGLGLKPISVIDPSVIIAPGVLVGAGSYIAPGSILSPGSTIGRHALINQHVSIGHDSRLGDFVQACPGTRVSGWAQVGEGGFLGSNSVVAPKVSLGPWAVLGASSFASRDIPGGVTAVGNPAKPK
jgi:sugar O-acyltransferase (sialic acid O-acetyltransferase NeuD family)